MYILIPSGAIIGKRTKVKILNLVATFPKIIWQNFMKGKMQIAMSSLHLPWLLLAAVNETKQG